MKSTLFIFVLFTFYVENIKSAKILAVYPTPSISHQVVFRPLTNELIRRGHEVTVITTDPMYPPGEAPTNLTEIDVHDISYGYWRNVLKSESFANLDTIYEQMGQTIGSINDIFHKQVAVKEVQDIINKKKGEYDLLLLEAFIKPALIFTHIFKAPAIQISSLMSWDYNLRIIGAEQHFFLYPTQYHQRFYNLTIWEKLKELYKYWQLEGLLEEIEREDNKKLETVFGPDVPPLHELCNNVQMLFLNVNPIWVDNQPVPTNVVYMGGLHMTPPKPLPEDLQLYLDSSKNGVIYFSLGTNVIPSLLPPEKIKTFIKVFSQLPYNVIWKWDKDELPEHADNIKIFKWLPQSSLLEHPNVKLFITQGGLQSTDEAVNAGVPLIGIPMFADQWYNVEKYVHHGIGLQLDMPTLNEKDLKHAIERVIGDKRYRESILQLRMYMRDQPQTPLQRAVWWTEYVLRHGGARQLRARGANVSWTEYLELELVAAVVISLLALLLVMSLCIYKLWTVIRNNISHNFKIKTS